MDGIRRGDFTIVYDLAKEADTLRQRAEAFARSENPTVPHQLRRLTGAGSLSCLPASTGVGDGRGSGSEQVPNFEEVDHRPRPA